MDTNELLRRIYELLETLWFVKKLVGYLSHKKCLMPPYVWYTQGKTIQKSKVFWGKIDNELYKLCLNYIWIHKTQTVR